jgi:hypothetical protein
MKIEKRTYKLTFFMPILGSQPTNKEIHDKFISSKANSPRQADEEGEALPEIDEKGVTAFYRRKADDALCLLDYQVMGHFKEALNTLAGQIEVKAARSKADKFLFVSPREIPFMRDSHAIYEPDDRLQRPLRAQTMQGPRVSLACSEMLECHQDMPVSITITLELLDNKDLTWDHIDEALEYGKLKGLGQWRNGSYGRFTWERVDNKN